MSERYLSPKCLKLYVTVILAIISVVILVYAFRVVLVPAPFHNLLSDFGSYFSGVLLPIFTLLSVILLVLTLSYQRQQLLSQVEHFEHQQNAAFFDSYVLRFEMQYERYENLCNKNFPWHPLNEEEKGFKLYDYQQLSFISPEYTIANQAIEIIENIRDEPIEDFLKVDLTRRIRFYIDDVYTEAIGATLSLRAAYSLAKYENAFILLDLWKRAIKMISDLNTWKIISDDEFKSLRAKIEIPEKLSLPE